SAHCQPAGNGTTIPTAGRRYGSRQPPPRSGSIATASSCPPTTPPSTPGLQLTPTGSRLLPNRPNPRPPPAPFSFAPLRTTGLERIPIRLSRNASEAQQSSDRALNSGLLRHPISAFTRVFDAR